MAEMSAIVDRLAEEAGRDPSSITRASSLSLSDADDVIAANVDAMAAAGVGYLVCGWPEEGRGRVEHVASTILSDFTG